MRSSLTFLSIASLLLASCSTQAAVLEYDLKIDANDGAERALLLQAMERVAKRKSSAVETHAIVSASPVGTDAGILVVKMKNTKELERLQNLLELPFAFELKLQGKELKESPGTHEWIPTLITEADLADAKVLQKNGEVGIELLFNEAGHKKLALVFANNIGKNLGIFVGNVLMSGIKIGKTPAGERIIITGVPSLAKAQVFVDDVTVGLHITLSPRS